MSLYFNGKLSDTNKATIPKGPLLTEGFQLTSQFFVGLTSKGLVGSIYV